MAQFVVRVELHETLGANAEVDYEPQQKAIFVKGHLRWVRLGAPLFKLPSVTYFSDKNGNTDTSLRRSVGSFQIG